MYLGVVSPCMSCLSVSRCRQRDAFESKSLVGGSLNIALPSASHIKGAEPAAGTTTFVTVFFFCMRGVSGDSGPGTRCLACISGSSRGLCSGIRGAAKPAMSAIADGGSNLRALRGLSAMAPDIFAA